MNTCQEPLIGNGSISRLSGEENHAPPDTALPAWFDVWQVIWRRRGRLMVLLMIGLALAALYCLLSGPRYDSTAQLLVIKKRLDTAPITGPDQFHPSDDYLSTHMLLITSRRVIGRAIDKGSLQELEQFQDKGGLRRELANWALSALLGVEPAMDQREQLTTDIINSLVVTRDAQRPGINPSNEVMNLSFRGTVPADSPRVLNAVIASYQEFLQEAYRNTNAEAVELITQARLMVEKDLEAKEAAYQKFLAQTTPLLKAQDRGTAQQDRVIKIDGKLAALRMRRTEIEASIAMIENAIKSGRNPAATVVRMLPVPAADAAAPNDPAAPERRSRVYLEEELIGLKLQQVKLEAMYAKNNPTVQAVNRQLRAVRDMIVHSDADRQTDANEQAPIDLAAIKVDLLRQELDDLNISEQALTKLFDTEQKGASLSYLHEIQDEAHRKGIERDRLLYESILNRLKETSSVRDFGDYNAQVIGSALPGVLAVKRYVLFFGLAAFISVFVGFGWAYLAEMTVRRPRRIPAGNH